MRCILLTTVDVIMYIHFTGTLHDLLNVSIAICSFFFERTCPLLSFFTPSPFSFFFCFSYPMMPGGMHIQQLG